MNIMIHINTYVQYTKSDHNPRVAHTRTAASSMISCRNSKTSRVL